MKETYEDFLQLLKASINKSEVKINNVNWQSILQLSNIHKVLPLVYEALYNSEEFKNTDKTEFETAIERTIQEVKFIPKIADIRARIAVNPIDYYVKDPRRNLYKNLEWGEFIN